LINSTEFLSLSPFQLQNSPLYPSNSFYQFPQTASQNISFYIPTKSIIPFSSSHSNSLYFYQFMTHCSFTANSFQLILFII
jgi:hypothetical protein